MAINPPCLIKGEQLLNRCAESFLPAHPLSREIHNCILATEKICGKHVLLIVKAVCPLFWIVERKDADHHPAGKARKDFEKKNGHVRVLESPVRGIKQQNISWCESLKDRAGCCLKCATLDRIAYVVDVGARAGINRDLACLQRTIFDCSAYELARIPRSDFYNQRRSMERVQRCRDKLRPGLS